MINLSFTKPVDEKNGKDGEIIKTTESVKFEDTDSETVADQINKLVAQGYDVKVTLKPSIPKNQQITNESKDGLYSPLIFLSLINQRRF